MDRESWLTLIWASVICAAVLVLYLAVEIVSAVVTILMKVAPWIVTVLIFIFILKYFGLLK